MSKKTVAIAMSGGVDSSVAAYLLKKQGYQLIGVFMHLWADPDFSEAENKCCSLESRENARKVAKKLNIPFYTLNLAPDFKKIIVENFIDQYKKGLTPNPCIRCNQFIKFDILLEKVKKLGADYLATGHYLQLKKNKLFKAKDKTKDQSYFLYQINPGVLKYLLFPLAPYTKKEVWQIAKKNKLFPALNKESQDVCFVPKGKLNLFLRKYIKKQNKKRKVIDINNKKQVGCHDGLISYTYGQKAGIGGLGPYYIVKKDIIKNILYVTNNKKDPQLFKKIIRIKKIHWLNGQKQKFPLKCKAKCRYGQVDKEVIINKNLVEFARPERAPTPGQSIVFYKNNQLLGGAVII